MGLCGAGCWLGGRVGFCYLVGSEPPCCTRCVSVCHTFALGPSHGMRSVDDLCVVSEKLPEKKELLAQKKFIGCRFQFVSLDQMSIKTCIHSMPK